MINKFMLFVNKPPYKNRSRKSFSGKG